MWSGFADRVYRFILIMFGDGVVAQVVLSGGDKGDFQSINWGWVGFACLAVAPELY